MIIIIPARLDSKRVPEKPLQLINGTPVIQHTYFNTIQARCADRVIIATDSEKVASVCRSFDAEVFVSASVKVKNGTERCSLLAHQLRIPNSEPVINVQGDKYNVNPIAIDEMADIMHSCHAPVKHSTLFCMREHLIVNERDDPDVIKVVTNAKDEAMMFSRVYMPLSQKHCGIYGYHVSFLYFYIAMQYKHLEMAENLEQMRVLENGSTVYCPLLKSTSTAGEAINSMKDLHKANSGE